MHEVRSLIEGHCPGLYVRIAQALRDAEREYNRRAGQAPSEFLLEHTGRTAAIARKLALMEGVDPFLPVLVALFHDAGKFHDGGYHQDDVPEEEHAAALAEALLGEYGMPREDVAAVVTWLRALYDDRLPCAGACRIVQDADRLEKLGPLGVGAFFTKATLRGRGLVDALIQTASREMTYALAAPRSMFTGAGRQLAQEQGAKTVAFFADLLRDLERWGIAAFERRSILLQEEFRTRDGAQAGPLEVAIVMPRHCPECAGGLALAHERGRGVKCEKLTARFACAGCGWARETSFCLPVLA